MEIYPVPVTSAGSEGLQQPKHHGPSCLLGRSQQVLRSSQWILLTFPFRLSSKHSMHAWTCTRRKQCACGLRRPFISTLAGVRSHCRAPKRTGVARESTAVLRMRAWGLLLCTILPVSHCCLPARGLQRAES